MGVRHGLVVALVAGCSGGVNDSVGPPGFSGDDSTTAAAMTDPVASTSSSMSATVTSATVDPSTTGTTPGTTMSPSGTDTDPDTETGPGCLDTWRTDLAGLTVEELAVADDGTVFVVGNDDASGARLVSLDACTGESAAPIDVGMINADHTHVSDLVIDGGSIYVSGTVETATDPGNGYIALVEGDPLTVTESAGLFGTAERDELWDIAVNTTGRVWQTGVTRVDIMMHSVWSVRTVPPNSACGFGWGGVGSGNGRAVVITDDGVAVLATDANDQIVMLTYPDDDCDCACQPDTVSAPVAVGSNTTSIGSAVVVVDQIYVAAWATDAGDPDNIYAALVWLDADGNFVDAYIDDATAADDGYLQIATDGDRVYVGGLDGWTGGSFANASARLDALPVPLPLGATPDWSGAPDDLDYIPGLAVDGTALYVAGNSDGEGVIVRCDKDTGCEGV